MMKMYYLGASRFGIGCSSALAILKEAEAIGHDIRPADYTINEDEL